MDDIEHTTLLLHALRLALRNDRHLDANELVHRHTVEIGVQKLVRDRIELILLYEHTRVAAAGQIQCNQRISALFGAQDARQHFRVDGDGLAAFLLAVDHGGNAAAGTQPLCLVLAS